MVNSSSRFSFAGAAALLAVTALACALFGGYTVASYQGTDENGYLLTAKRLATQGEISKRTADPNEFVSSNWVEAREDVYYAKYPIGYPALCALAYKLGGPSAVFLVNPILAVLAVVGMFFLGRAMFGDFAGALAAIFLATNPMHAFYGISALSHTGAICFAIWGMLFIWRWSERGGWWNAILGSACTAYAPSVRYTEALLVLPAAAVVIWRCVDLYRDRSVGGRHASDAFEAAGAADSTSPAISSGTAASPAGRWRRLPWAQLATMLAVGLVAIAPLLIQHWVAYGSPWTSGYSLCGESTGFGWKWFDQNWRLMLGRMDSPGLFLIFPIGLAGLLYLSTHRAKSAAFLALWALPSLLVYTAYYWAPGGDGPWYIRFFVSIFPPLIVSALALLCLAVPSRPAWNVALGLFTLLVAGVNLNETTRQLDRKTDGLLFSQALCDAVRSRLPSGSVILSDEGVLNYVEFAGDYRLYSQAAYDRNALQGRIKILNDTDPHPFQRRKAKDIAAWLGKKTDAQLNELLCDQLARQLAEGRDIAVIAAQYALPRWRGRLSHRYQFSTLAECVEMRQNPKGEFSYASWSICSLKPIDKTAVAMVKPSAALETKVEQTRFRLEAMRSEYQQQYPGARESWTKITDLEKQMRDLQEELKRAKAREKAVVRNAQPSPPAAMKTAAPANSHAAIGPPAPPLPPAKLAIVMTNEAARAAPAPSLWSTNLVLLGTNFAFKTSPRP